MDQSSFAAPQGLSQRTTSFIASQRQGIHQMLLRHLIALMIHVRRFHSRSRVAAHAPSAEERRRSERPVPGSRQERILLAKWTRSHGPAGAAAGGQLNAANRIHSLFTISNTRTPSHKEQNARVSFDPRGSQRTAPRVSLTFRTADPSGGARRDRTDDLMLAKHALSQLSYGPLRRWPPRERRGWWAWDDSNVRPHPYQGCALTT